MSFNVPLMLRTMFRCQLTVTKGSVIHTNRSADFSGEAILAIPIRFAMTLSTSEDSSLVTVVRITEDMWLVHEGEG